MARTTYHESEKTKYFQQVMATAYLLSQEQGNGFYSSLSF